MALLELLIAFFELRRPAFNRFFEMPGPLFELLRAIPVRAINQPAKEENSTNPEPPGRPKRWLDDDD